VKGTINRMPSIPKHAEPEHAKTAHRDHLWVLAVIAAFALFDVWGAWAQVGDKSGFTVGGTGTGWTLTVIVEAAAGYFLFAWFSAPGTRSRRFAMWSAIATLTLSLIGQGASTVAAKSQPPVWLAVFIKDLPVVTLALIAVLIHMRRLDREDIAETAQQDGKDAEIAALRTELDTLRAGLEAAEDARAEAERQAAASAAREEVTARKLAAALAAKRTVKPPPKKPEATSRVIPPEQRKRMVRELFSKNPSISIKAVADELGWSRDTVSPILTELQNEANIRPMERRQA